MKRICNISLFLFLVFLPISVFAIVKQTEDFFVNDYANVLTEETEKKILDKSIYLDKQTSAQIVVVTVPNLNGTDIEKYATDLFRSFGIGGNERNNGLLLLFALEEREFRVEVGYGLEGILPDGKVGRILDESVIPFLKENDYDKGIKNGYNLFLNEVCSEYELNCNIDIIEPENGEEIIDIIYIIIAIIILINIISQIMNSKRKKGHKRTIWYDIFDIISISGRLFGDRSSSSSRGYSGRGGSSGGGGASRRF